MLNRGHISWASKYSKEDREKQGTPYKDSEWYKYEDIASKYKKFRPSNNHQSVRK